LAGFTSFTCPLYSSHFLSKGPSGMFDLNMVYYLIASICVGKMVC
jgi:hypothetical protein